MTKGLSTELADSAVRILIRRPGILPAAMVAGLAVLPAFAAADPAPRPGVPVLRLAQTAADTAQPAGEEPARREDTPPQSAPADSPAEAGEPAAEPAQEPAAEEPAAEEPAAEAAETPAQEPAAEAAETPSEEPAAKTAGEQPAAESPAGYPPILRKDSDMPEPVRKTWTALRDAARKGDIEALQPLIDAQPSPPTFAFDEIDQPILYLKSLSGDPEGREILAILLEVLESGFVLADPDTPEAMYLWPYFARYPLEQLTPEQMVEMFTLLTAGDYQDMLSYGAYIFFRVGISPDGAWHFFVAGD